MKNLFICYPKCTTCQKAKKWLADNNIEFDERNIAENNPTKAELGKWIKASGMPVKKFFNTSGIQYRELGLKDKLGSMSDDEMIKLLATSGMLVKRPIFVSGERVLVGFKESEWEKIK